MSAYSDWMATQSEEFRVEILGESPIGEKFVDENFAPITLSQLRELDDKHNAPWAGEVNV